MASPFKFFRKNQKLWLAGLTILAMGGFVVLPTIVQMTGQGYQAAARKDVVSTTRYGNLTKVDLANLQSERQLVRRFMGEVDRQVRIKQRNNQGPTLAQMLSMGLSIDEKAIVETWLLVNHADELGIVIDDTAVNSFIQQITEGVVTQSDMKGLLDAIGVPESQLFRVLAQELKALRIQQLVQSGLAPMTPGERWDFYQRLHRNMTVELAEVPVDRFVDSVNDPDDATLKMFFDKYKDKENAPESPEPGFMIPKRIAVEYFKVDYDHLFAPGELEKYYEEHKEEFKRESLPAVKPADPAPDLKGSLPGLEDPQLDPPAPDQSAPKSEGSESKTEPVTPEGEEKPAANPETSETKDEAAKPDQQTTPEETNEGAAEPKPEEAPKPTEESRTNRHSVFQLTAYQAGEEAETAENSAETKTEPPMTDPPQDSQPSAEEKQPAEEKPADENAAESKVEEPKSDPATEKPEPSKEMPAEENAAAPAEGAKAETPSALDVDMPKFDPPSEYNTFEEVKSEIQNRLAPEKIERLFRPLENVMTLHHDAHIRYIREQDDQGNSSVPKPQSPDFAKLAAEAGIEAKKTELFSQREASELQLDIARSRVTVGTEPVSFLIYAFDSMTELRPARSQDVEGNHYLFWKTLQEAERVPELDDEGIRSMVVNAWKMIEARGAAQAEAERLAAEARAKQEASKEPVALATSLSGEQGITVQSTEPFTWFDSMSISLYMMGYGQPRLSTIKLVAPEPKEGEKPAEPETVPFVGSDFMRAVAGLDQGGIGVAWNEPRTVVYVAHVTEIAPDTKELQSQFLASADPRQLQVVASLDRSEAFRAWIKSLETTVGLKWHQ